MQCAYGSMSVGVEVARPEMREAFVFVRQLTVVNYLLRSGGGVHVARVKANDLDLCVLLEQDHSATDLLDEVLFAR